MHKVALIDPASDQRWDDFVMGHPFGWICHHSGWKRALEASFSHIRGHCLAVVDEAGDIRAGLPIFEVKSWLTGNRLVSIPFATLSDPLITDVGEADALAEAAIELSKKLKIPRIEIRTLRSRDLTNDRRFSRSCFYKHHYLEINIEPEHLMKTFHYKAVRYEINRSQKSGLTLSTATNEEELRSFHALHTRTRSRLGLPSQPYIFFQSLWRVFFPLGMITLLLASHDQELVAGQLYFKFKDRVSMEFEAWNRNRRDLAANHFLIWEAIKRYHSEGYRTFDFGRTSVDNVPLMNFKRRWGTQTIDLPEFHYPVDGSAITGKREDRMAYRLVHKMCKSAPGFAVDVISRFCYKHLG